MLQDQTPVPERVGTTAAADLAGVSRRTIHRAAADGRLPAELVGNAYVFLRADVEKWAKAQAPANA